MVCFPKISHFINILLDNQTNIIYLFLELYWAKTHLYTMVQNTGIHSVMILKKVHL